MLLSIVVFSCSLTNSINESIQEFEYDEWLEKSLQKSERFHPDFDPSCEMEDLELKLNVRNNLT